MLVSAWNPTHLPTTVHRYEGHPYHVVVHHKAAINVVFAVQNVLSQRHTNLHQHHYHHSAHLFVHAHLHRAMSEEHNNKTYRPKSPDLSGFHPPPRLARIPSYHPDPTLPPGYPVSARGSYDASPFFSPQTTTPSTSYFGARTQSSFPASYSPQTFRTPSTANQPSPSTPSQTLPQSYNNSHPSTYNNQFQSHPSIEPSYFAQQPYQQPSYYPEGHPPQYVDMPRTRQRKAAGDFDHDYNPNGPATGMQLKTEPVNTTQSVMPVANADPSHGIDVRTKFPVARIKRIMQADEDVGKVAQATPTAVCE